VAPDPLNPPTSAESAALGAIDAAQGSLNELQRGFAALSAPMLAHEVNNLLTPVLFHVEQARRECVAQTPAWERLGRVEDGLVHALEVVRKLVPQSHPIDRSCSDMLSSISEAVRGLSHELAAVGGAEIQSNIAKGELQLGCDPAVLRQVVVNILLNAKRAINTSSAGRIIVRVNPHSRPQHTQHLALANCQVRNPAVIEIADSGCGFDLQLLQSQSSRKRRRESSGAGLGLEICRRLLESVGGGLDIWSTPGAGTCVRVSLPCIPNKTRVAA
jgi:signal transduction histidine kinase